MQASAEVASERGRTFVRVGFPYSKPAVDAIKTVPGAAFVSREKGGPHWKLPLDLTSMRRLSELFEVELGPQLIEWGREAVAKERKLRSLSTADDIPLSELKINRCLPDLAKWLRPYQRADVAFLATTSALNLNEPRLGKTVEVIAAIYEAGLELGPHLVIAPRTSLETIWRMELERWQDIPVFTYSGDTPQADRINMPKMIAEAIEVDKGYWFVTTANMVRDQKDLFTHEEWNTITIDEYHKTGLPEIKNKFPTVVNSLKSKRRYALSGTPMGGKPIKLWGGLHFLEPDQYTSKWRWADLWLDVEKEVVHTRKGKKTVAKIGGIRDGREGQFYASLAPHAVRRLRSEVLPQLPPKQVINVWCPMTAKQRAQYIEFAAEAEIRIDEHRLSATSILAEYTRLKQFANSRCEVEVVGYDEENDRPLLKLLATPDSGKIPYLMERLAEVGIDPDEPEGTAQAIVASQFKETADMIHSHLSELGIKCAKITGDVTKRGERERVQRAFQAGGDSEGLRVVVMTTTAGGVAITLDNVESVHVLDETWNPDDQEQLTDRAINTTKLHQVSCFYYRSRATVEEYIYKLAGQKALTNKSVLDLRRVAYKEAMKKAAA